MDVDSARRRRSEISARLPSVDLRLARSERVLWACGECPVRSAAPGVGGERTHLDKCTIWHCSRENRRPCARAAPPPAPANHEPSRHSLRLFWRERVVWTTAKVARAPLEALSSRRQQHDFSVTTFRRNLVNDIRACIWLNMFYCSYGDEP